VSPVRRALLAWLATGVAGFFVVPWYALQDTLLSVGWLGAYAGKDNAPGVLQAALHGRAWLWPIG